MYISSRYEGPSSDWMASFSCLVTEPLYTKIILKQLQTIQILSDFEAVHHPKTVWCPASGESCRYFDEIGRYNGKVTVILPKVAVIMGKLPLSSWEKDPSPRPYSL